MVAGHHLPFWLLLENVAFILHGDIGWGVFVFKPVVSLLEVGPEAVPAVVFFLLHAVGGHAEREDVDAEERLAAGEGFGAEGVDFLDAGVGHGETARGDAVAVDHDE